MKFDLASRIRHPSRRPIILANVKPTQAQATDLAALYLRVVSAWSNAADRIVAVYAAALGELVTDSADDAGSLIERIEAEVRRLVLLLTPELRDWVLRVEKVHRRKWVANILSAASVDLETILSADDVSETVDAAVNWNVSLVRDVNEEARRRIANAVFSGLQQRKRADDVAKEIRAITGMARARARRIAGDQTVKLGARLNRARREQAGIGQYKWRHSGKLHPRSWHKARDGIVYKNDDPRIPADDRAGVPPFCGCTEQAVLVFDE